VLAESRDINVFGNASRRIRESNQNREEQDLETMESQLSMLVVSCSSKLIRHFFKLG